MVTKYRRQIAARVDDATYQKLCKQAVTNGLSLSVFLRKMVTNFFVGTESDSPVSNINADTSNPEVLKEPTIVELAEIINLKKVESEIVPSEPLEHKEEDKPRGLLRRVWDKFDEIGNTKITIF